MRPLCLAFLALAPVATVHAQDEGMVEAQLVLAVSSAGEAAPGAERLGDMRTGTLRQGQARRFPATVPAGACVAAYGRAVDAVQNLDLALARGRTVLARDTSTGSGAELRFCAGERAERATLTVSAFRGSGMFAAAVYRVPAGAAGTAPQEGASVLDRLEARRRAVGGDLEPVTPPQRETLGEGESLERTVGLRPGRCYRVVTASEDSVADLDLAIATPAGAMIQRDASDDGVPTLGVLGPLCPADAGEHRLTLTMARGHGAFAWRVLANAQGTAPPAPAEQASRFRVGGTGTGFVAARIRDRHRVAGEGRPPVSDLVVGRLATSEQRDLELQVEGGRCYVALAAGVPSAREIDLTAIDPFGTERAQDATRDAFPSIRFCAQVSGRWKVRVRMFNGYGEYGMQVFGR